MDGSSSTYNVPTRRDPREVASWIRCASPPDRVDDKRLSVRYSSPTSFKNFSRSSISSSSFSAMPASCVVSVTSEKNCEACSTVRLQTSQILWPLIFTWRASTRSRAPPQVEQREYPRYRLRKTRTCSLYFLRSRGLKNPHTPGKRPSQTIIIRCCYGSSDTN